MKSLDRYRGCLLGAAAGDALGYAVEFLDADSILRRYGGDGITEYALVNGTALISDDTQMTLFTANGLLLGTTRDRTRGTVGGCLDGIASCCEEWLRTQTETYPVRERYPCSWLTNVPELFERRAPGNTCLSAIASFRGGRRGTIDEPINDSKGCGGIMRVAPIGLYFDGERHTSDEVARLGAEAAALTHGHELGYIPAAALVHIVHTVSHSEDPLLADAVWNAMSAMGRLFPGAEHLDELEALVRMAVELSQSDLGDLDAIRMLGEGWVAEETLAIAVYCALKYENDFDRALIAAVNHSGDSDSTGAVTGNILGARLGARAIPEKYLARLELKDVVSEIAEDLFSDCGISGYGPYRDELWANKYVFMTYAPSSRGKVSSHWEGDGGIALPAEYVRLREDVERLRAELLALLLERDELVHVTCRNIEMRYMLTLGALEYKAYELHCTVLRLKRKIEMIQARRNRQEKLVLSEIESALDDEFDAYRRRLDEQIHRMNAALERNRGKLLSKEDARELKRLYRAIVKALHPDLHPDADPAQARLFHNAVSAYENGDLNGLRLIGEMASAPVLPDRDEDGLVALEKEKERLTELLEAVREEIEGIKDEYPYILKSIVESPERTAAKRAELEKDAARLRETHAYYQNRLVGLLRLAGIDSGPGETNSEEY